MTGAAAQAPLTHPLQVPLWIDLAAVVVGALAGTGVAVREQFDVVGVLLLAVVMGLQPRCLSTWARSSHPGVNGPVKTLPRTPPTISLSKPHRHA